jgi:hypothetical protein
MHSENLLWAICSYLANFFSDWRIRIGESIEILNAYRRFCVTEVQIRQMPDTAKNLTRRNNIRMWLTWPELKLTPPEIICLTLNNSASQGRFHNCSPIEESRVMRN